MMPGVDYSAIQKSIADSTRLEDIYSDAQQLKAMTSHVPVVTKQDPEALQKAWRTMSMEKPVKGPKSVFFDPLSLQYAMGYKDRRYSLTYDTLKRIVNQLSIVAAIVNTRIAQIAAFAMPYRTTKSLGFMVKHKSPEHMTTQSERRFIQMLEAFVSSCGEPGRRNPYSRFDRDDFEAFLKKIVRDTMTYDQIGIEIVPRNNTIPFEFLAVDGSTLRLASADRFPGSGSEYSYHARNVVGGFTPYRFQGLYTGSYGLNNPRQTDPESIQYVQVVNGQIENVYTRDELAFGVRNPRTDIYIQGYGFGEIEQLITIITSLLYAEEYNKRYFTQGSHPKGVLNFKGDNWTPDQLEAFKRQWIAQVAGTENSWKTPITQSEGIEWINLQMSNKEMEFGRWIEYLIKIVCGVFLIDPAEINFDLHGGVQQTPLFESSQEWKLKASRDRGLKPLLRFIAKLINTHIIDKIDDHFVFEFVGLDELSEQEKHEMLKEQTASYMTLNEGRRSLDLPDLPYGDVPMNQAYLQVLQLKMQENQQAEQKEQQEQQMAAQQQQAAAQQPGQPPSGQEGAPPQGPVGAPPQGPMGAPPQGVPGVNPGGPEAAAGVGAVPEPTGEPTPEEAAAVNPPPQYAANFGKSMKGSREIVITLDHWKDMKRG